jgi:hypothetical protein
VVDKKRKERNEDIVKRMKNGEDLSTIERSATWWPPRPIIKKSKKDIEKVYKKSE